jgi:hypothetical protein
MRPALGNNVRTYLKKITKGKSAVGLPEVVQQLPIKYKTLSSNALVTNKIRKK